MAEVDRKPVAEEPARRKRRPRGRPKGHRISIQQSEWITAISTRLELPDGILTWADAAYQLSKREGIRIGAGTLWRFGKLGIEPKRAAVRRALRLPPLVLTSACEFCGVVHVAKRCPRVPHKPTKPRRTRRWRNLLNMRLAADWLRGRER